MKVLFIDNFDSFTYNLVEEFQKRKCEVLVYRNNLDIKIIDKAVKKFNPSLIVISPGPARPRDAGNSNDIIKNYTKKSPYLVSV
jgi:anthranilate synthase component 2